MKVDDILARRKELAAKLKGSKPSRAKTTLLKLLKMHSNELLYASANAWIKKRYGVKIGDEIPASLLPDADDPDEFFQWLTNSLKRNIGKY